MDLITTQREATFPEHSRAKRPSLSAEIEERILYKAILSRRVDERLLEMFAEGKLAGTVHTCIGQEFTGAVITEFLRSGDAIFSNHRCHGHFLSFTDNVDGLISELMGRSSGVCAGRGGSQHLCWNGFYSNGIQGGTTPISSGVALAKKLDGKDSIAVAFIGDGTLGEGVLYETLNLASKWQLPLLFVLENNRYAQSTSQEETLAGDILARAAAFGITTLKADTWNWKNFYVSSAEVVHNVRMNKKPAFIQVDTYRLKAHSKGDDSRPRSEVEPFEKKDPIYSLSTESGPLTKILGQVNERIKTAETLADNSPFPTLPKKEASAGPVSWETVTVSRKRVVKAINEAFIQLMSENSRIMFIGEDVLSPYGGAFKVSQGLSDAFPARVYNTPISEAAIVGLGIGLAMEGRRPFIEIMFGDFLCLATDQLLNHASKFSYMFNDQVRVDFVVRTPMGGGRGYGPTHSQTLDRHFLGIPGLRVIAINNLMEPYPVYRELSEGAIGPTLLIENKVLYGTYLRTELPEGFQLFSTQESFPLIHLKPLSEHIDVTLVGYGGMSDLLVSAAAALFDEHDIIAQVIVPTQIYPFQVEPYLDLFAKASALVTVEEGQGFSNFSSELVSQIAESPRGRGIKVGRLAAAPIPIPASAPLEKEVLPSLESIINKVKRTLDET